MLQGKTKEINTGIMFRYLLSEASKYTGLKKGAAVAIGTYYRVKDSFIPAFQLEWTNFLLGISYDANISKFKPATGGKGGIEFMLQYINPNPFGGKTGGQNVRFL
jgi:hypothetical protein